MHFKAQTIVFLQFELGAIGFDTSAVGIVVLKNTGLTPTRFRFASQHQSLSTPLIADSWLTVTPNNSFIDVDSDVSITLEVRVKNAEAQRVQKSTALSCILVIKLDGGRDYFLVVSATYVPPSVSGELNHQREQQPQQQQQRQQQQPLQQQQLQQQQLQQQSQQQSKLMNNEDWLIKFVSLKAPRQLARSFDDCRTSEHHKQLFKLATQCVRIRFYLAQFCS